MLDEQRKVGEVRAFLNTMYNGDLGGPTSIVKVSSQLSDDEILTLADNLREGATLHRPCLTARMRVKSRRIWI